MDYEKKINSKLYRFFDLLYKLFMLNLLTVVFSALIITFFPAVVALNASIKNDLNEANPFKMFFRNFKNYFLKSFLTGLILLLVALVASFAFYFYSFAVPQNQANEIIFQMGIVVIFILLLVVLMVCVHIPLILITFDSLSVMEIIKTSIFISFRYFITTLILFALLVVEVVGVVAFPIWIVIGISLPVFLGIRFTRPIYYKFEAIDLDKISHQVEEEMDE